MREQYDLYLIPRMQTMTPGTAERGTRSRGVRFCPRARSPGDLRCDVQARANERATTERARERERERGIAPMGS